MLEPLTILITAVGCPGTVALLRSLRENGEREVRLVGVDMNAQAIGRHLCDVFATVPAGSDPGFAGAILEICRREGVDVVLPQSSHTLEGLAIEKESFGDIVVVVASIEAIRRSNDKAETLALCDKIGVRAPAWRQAGARTPILSQSASVSALSLERRMASIEATTTTMSPKLSFSIARPSSVCDDWGRTTSTPSRRQISSMAPAKPGSLPAGTVANTSHRWRPIACAFMSTPTRRTSRSPFSRSERSSATVPGQPTAVMRMVSGSSIFAWARLAALCLIVVRMRRRGSEHPV